MGPLPFSHMQEQGCEVYGCYWWIPEPHTQHSIPYIPDCRTALRGSPVFRKGSDQPLLAELRPWGQVSGSPYLPG